MNKKLLTLAVGAALAATSGIAAAEVNWYGKFNMALQTVDSSDDAEDNELDVASGGSRLGFRASDELDNGMTAWVWSEWKMDPSDGTDDGQFKNRDTQVGISGDFGTVAAGNAATSYKSVSASFDMFGDTVGDFNKYGFAQPAGPGIGYGNSIGPISFGIGGSTSQGDSTAKAAAGAKIVYSEGPLTAALAVHSFDTLHTNTAGWKDLTIVGAKYKMDGMAFQAAFESMESQTTGKDEDSWTIGASFDVGGPTVKAQYTSTDSDGKDSGGDLMAIGIGTNLSDNTSVGFNYATGESDATTKVDYDGWDLGVTVNF